MHAVNSVKNNMLEALLYIFERNFHANQQMNKERNKSKTVRHFTSDSLVLTTRCHNCRTRWLPSHITVANISAIRTLVC